MRIQGVYVLCCSLQPATAVLELQHAAQLHCRCKMQSDEEVTANENDMIGCRTLCNSLMVLKHH